MEITGPNSVKLPLSEHIYEVISLIKPTHEQEECTFLEGPIWATRRGHYNDKLVNRSYHIINHHIYTMYKMDVWPIEKATYWRVSGRGNINEIDYEKAVEIVNTRTGYVEDSVLAELPENDDPAIPYKDPNCDW